MDFNKKIVYRSFTLPNVYIAHYFPKIPKFLNRYGLVNKAWQIDLTKIVLENFGSI
jgi:hypothetical protein